MSEHDDQAGPTQALETGSRAKPRIGAAGATRAATKAGEVRAIEVRARAVGAQLAQSLGALHLELFPPRCGPKRAADLLGQPVPMASRVLAALAEHEPLALLHRLPGPDPLKRWARAAGRKGASGPAVQAALEAIEAFQVFIDDEGGDRSALDAQLVAWLPEARKTLSLRRRQAVFRGLSELEGISCHLDLSSIVLHPSPDGRHVDLLCIQARTGICALRPGLQIKFSTERVVAAADASARHPQNLDGTDSFDAPAGVRLDEFCAAPPAQLQVQQHEDRFHYLLSTPGLGAKAEVDFVIAELNQREFTLSSEPRAGGPFFSNLIQSPTRLGVNDVIVHPSLGPLQRPEIHLYRSIGETQARPGDPAREVDRIESTEPLQQSMVDLASMRLPGLPRYGELLAAVLARLGWHFDSIPLYRTELAYPVPGTQITLLFRDTRF